MRVERVELQRILPLRERYLEELGAQSRYHACHERGWLDSYLLTVDGGEAGYAAVKGREIAGRDIVFECFVVPALRGWSGRLFREVVTVSGARYVECHTNDLPLTALAFEFGHELRADVVLFSDHEETRHAPPGATVRRRRATDDVFSHTGEPVGDFVVETDGEVVATGGFLLHYNPPFADLFMEVREDHRRRGYAAFLLQELKRACYQAGRVPAARCNIRNAASRASLRKAGMSECGFMLTGTLAPEASER